MWTIVNTSTGRRLGEDTYSDGRAAQARIDRLGPAFREVYRVHLEHTDKRIRSIVNEGIKKNDLEGILLPRISIDEYVPADPNTDNVVLAFLIKGVPEAVDPFKKFCEKSQGVISADSGESESIPNTSIIYAEFDREKLDIHDVHALVVQAGITSNMSASDFMMSFPNSDRKYPYNVKVLAQYFIQRSREANSLAQEKAVKDRTDQLQKEIDKEMANGKTAKVLQPNPTPTIQTPAPVYQQPKRQQAKPHVPGRMDDAEERKIQAAATHTDFKRTGSKMEFDRRWARILNVSPTSVATVRRKATKK